MCSCLNPTIWWSERVTRTSWIAWWKLRVIATFRFVWFLSQLKCCSDVMDQVVGFYIIRNITVMYNKNKYTDSQKVRSYLPVTRVSMIFSRSDSCFYFAHVGILRWTSLWGCCSIKLSQWRIFMGDSRNLELLSAQLECFSSFNLNMSCSLLKLDIFFRCQAEWVESTLVMMCISVCRFPN